MAWSSIAAIYFLFWVFAAFLVMPFHVRTADQTGDTPQAGHAESAPVNFRPLRIMTWTTIVSIVLFAAYYANYVNSWITTDAFQIKW
ncbi:MAG: hypothetical protein RIS52_1134 [Pseudomonadota bacterium]|jgi:predicted secreted protein